MLTLFIHTTQGESHSTLRPTEIARLRDLLSQTWEAVRSYLSSHSGPSERSASASHQGQFLWTPLHMACKLVDPPADVIQLLIEANAETPSWQDSSGWLPLHHACYNGASCRVLQILVDAYERGKVTQDKRSRTPLHFAFFPRDLPNVGEKKVEDGADGEGEGDEGLGNSMPEVVRLLSDSGAARLQDEGGMVSKIICFFFLCDT
jgi:ankyrin repeat protein